MDHFAMLTPHVEITCPNCIAHRWSYIIHCTVKVQFSGTFHTGFYRTLSGPLESLVHLDHAEDH